MRQKTKAKTKPIAVEKKLLEKDIEIPVCKYARLKGFKAEKFKSPNNRAVPDRLITGPDRRIFFIEFKAPGEPATEAQGRDHTARREHGFDVYVIDNVQEGKQLIDTWSQAINHRSNN